MDSAAIHKAAWSGMKEMLEDLLINLECNINIGDEVGKTPLHWAASGGRTQCVQLLLQHGADTNIQDLALMTPLHCAAYHGHTQCVQLLLQHGADPNIQQREWKTPLHWAASGGHTQCVQLLLQHGADPNIQQRDGKTPLHRAADHGHTQCVQLQHGADTSLQDGDRKTQLNWTASGGHTQCVQLLQHGGDTSIQDMVGYTPLHWAAYQGHTKCVQLLLQHGADPCIQNLTKKRPSMLAEEGCHDDIARLLRRFELPTIQTYMLSRILQHLGDVEKPEFLTFNQSLNSLGYLKSQEGQVLKDWAIKNEYTTFRDLYVGLRAENSQLSDAAMEQYVEVLTEISNMSSDAFETLCRTFDAAVCIFTPSSSTNGLQEKSLPLDPYRHDAFIAYSGEDEATIEPVLHQLKECLIQCWYAKEDLELGTYLIHSISEAVRSSKHTIVFLSKSFIHNGWCQVQLEHAMKNAIQSKKNVIPVVLNISTREIPFELKGLKYLFLDDEELIPKLVEAIKGPRELPDCGKLRDENMQLRDEVQQLTHELRL